MTRLNLVESLEEIVGGSSLGAGVLPETDFKDFFGTKTVDYSGEEVQVALV